MGLSPSLSNCHHDQSCSTPHPLTPSTYQHIIVVHTSCTFYHFICEYFHMLLKMIRNLFKIHNQNIIILSKKITVILQHHEITSIQISNCLNQNLCIVIVTPFKYLVTCQFSPSSSPHLQFMIEEEADLFVFQILLIIFPAQFNMFPLHFL